MPSYLTAEMFVERCVACKFYLNKFFCALTKLKTFFFAGLSGKIYMQTKLKNGNGKRVFRKFISSGGGFFR
jgi:hypothetical protein